MGQQLRKITVKPTGRYGGYHQVGRYLVPNHVFVEASGNDGEPTLHLHVECRGALAQVVELKVTSGNRQRRLSQADLIAINLDTIAQRAVVEASMMLSDNPAGGWTAEPLTGDTAQDQVLLEALRTTLAHPEPDAPSGMGELDKVAAIYQKYQGRDVLLAVSEHFGTSRRTAARRIAQARTAGLLAPSRRQK